MIKLIYIGEYRKQDIYDLKSGDIYEFDRIDFITLAEWRDKQINFILND
jgi:hypothetical protein